MTRLLLLISVVMSIILTGCAKVPECGDAKTTSLVNDLVLQSLLGEEAKNLSDMFKVEISSVQTVAHSKDPEKYNCKANIKISTIGKMNELFGNASDEISRTFNGKASTSDLAQLEKYSALSKYLKGKVNLAPHSVLEELSAFQSLAHIQIQHLDGLDSLSFMLELARNPRPPFPPVSNSDLEPMRRLFSTDVSTNAVMESSVVMLNIATALPHLREMKTIEFVSTAAQQNGTSQHLVEIQKLWPQPDALIIELAKFSKAYEPKSTTIKPVAAKPMTAVEDAVKRDFELKVALSNIVKSINPLQLGFAAYIQDHGVTELPVDNDWADLGGQVPRIEELSSFSISKIGVITTTVNPGVAGESACLVSFSPKIETNLIRWHLETTCPEPAKSIINRLN
ncbi:MAG: hypothetical protein FD173_468 [Gallionellaceae bacterium]|nr:MAG: hypothetical protein FD173_468 [Gallionellaceae bacterium]